MLPYEKQWKAADFVTLANEQKVKIEKDVKTQRAKGLTVDNVILAFSRTEHTAFFSGNRYLALSAQMVLLLLLSSYWLFYLGIPITIKYLLNIIFVKFAKPDLFLFLFVAFT